MHPADSYSDAFWAGQVVAVTGGSGFVGHHVAMLLRERGAIVTALVRPSSRIDRLKQAGIECLVAPLEEVDALRAALTGCETVFHLAGAVDFGADWERFLEANVRGTERVLDAAAAAGVRRVVVTSSVVAIGATTEPTELDETAEWNLEKLCVPYITTKRWAEEAALARSRPEVVVVNPSSVIGPDDFNGSEFGTLCQRFWKGRIPVYFGGGANFVDVRDVAAGHLLAAERGRPGERYILGGHNLSYGAFFRAAASVATQPILRCRVPALLGHAVAALNARVPRPGKRPYLTAGQVHLLSRFLFYSSKKAERELGYRIHPLQETLADAYAFWMNRRAA